MKINCKIRFEREYMSSESAHNVAYSLQPDNLPNMCTKIDEDAATTYLHTEKITTLISTLDDFLINAKIAEDVYGLKI
ncbi:MAG: KEOPS complex subunit Pcc1 [Methanohalobium sp.]|uniref:KEOPS complex subunit Pcc1 n=1 Tax=Methanohalobium sp. TaxID=2837493 RepID=UPI003979FD06